jgi:hypothetical protein
MARCHVIVRHVMTSGPPHAQMAMLSHKDPVCSFERTAWRSCSSASTDSRCLGHPIPYRSSELTGHASDACWVFTCALSNDCGCACGCVVSCRMKVGPYVKGYTVPGTRRRYPRRVFFMVFFGVKVLTRFFTFCILKSVVRIG